ncbi:MAG TPA: hypothetical protein VEM15_15525, partial [Thermodesulfobacteriota bacterium]|nr:hypothetical protein [Thermodesulfobacteriota bacterium]
METLRFCRLIGAGLSVLILVACAHQRTYFGIARGEGGNPLLGFYESGQFISIKLERDSRQRAQDIIAFNRSFPIGEAFAGVSFEGRSVEVQIKSKKEYWE